MAIVKRDEIVGIWIEKKLLCHECAIKEEKEGILRLDKILTLDELDKDADTIYFCDSCKEVIQYQKFVK